MLDKESAGCHTIDNELHRVDKRALEAQERIGSMRRIGPFQDLQCYQDRVKL